MSKTTQAGGVDSIAAIRSDREAEVRHRGWARLGEIVFPVRGRVLLPVYLVYLIVWWHVTAYRLEAYLLGVALVGAGLFLRGWSRRYMGRSSDAHVARAPRLVTGGPYRFSRNPLYVANIAQVVGMGMASGLLWFVAVALVLHVIQYHAIILYEEATLRKLWGESYEGYRARTPRWLGLARREAGEVSTPVLGMRDTLWRERRIIAGSSVGLAILALRLFVVVP